MRADRRPLLRAALGFAQLSPSAPELRLLHRWLDSWPGLGAVVAGLTAQGLNLELRQFPDGWRANVFDVGIAHSVIRGSAWERTAWRAVQRAGWEATSFLKGDG